MDFEISTARALVPYQKTPRDTAKALALFIRRIFTEADKRYKASKKVYTAFLFVCFFGFALGSYASNFTPVNFAVTEDFVFTTLLLHSLVAFLSGMTLWGIGAIPFLLFTLSFSVSLYIREVGSLIFDSFPLRLIFGFFIFFLLSAESLATWSRCKFGWKTMVLCRSFLLNISYLITVILFAI